MTESDSQPRAVWSNSASFLRVQRDQRQHDYDAARIKAPGVPPTAASKADVSRKLGGDVVGAIQSGDLLRAPQLEPPWLEAHFALPAVRTSENREKVRLVLMVGQWPGRRRSPLRRSAAGPLRRGVPNDLGYRDAKLVGDLTPRRSGAAFYHNCGPRAQRAGRFHSPRRRQQRLVRRGGTTAITPCRAPGGHVRPPRTRGPQRCPPQPIRPPSSTATALGRRSRVRRQSPNQLPYWPSGDPLQLRNRHLSSGDQLVLSLTPRRSAAASYHNCGPRAQRAGRFQSPRRRQQRLVRWPAAHVRTAMTRHVAQPKSTMVLMSMLSSSQYATEIHSQSL